MTARETIDKYKLQLSGNGDSLISGAFIRQTDKEKVRESINENRAEIVAILRAEREEEQRAERERRAKIAAIEGLKEIEEAMNAEECYHYAFNKAMEDEYNDGVNMPKKPEVSSVSLLKAYPRAAAYILARSYSNAHNVDKSIAGSKALERIINGEDHELVIAEMKAEWSAAAEKAMWD